MWPNLVMEYQVQLDVNVNVNVVHVFLVKELRAISYGQTLSKSYT